MFLCIVCRHQIDHATRTGVHPADIQTSFRGFIPFVFLFFYSLHHRQMSFKKRPSARGTTTKKWTFSFFILMAVSFWSTARHCGAGKRTRDKPFTPVFFFYIFATVPENKTKHTQMLPPQYSRTVCLCVFSFVFANKHTRQLPKHQKNWENGRSILFAGRFVFNAILALPYIIYTQWLAYIGYTIQNAYIMYIELGL